MAARRKTANAKRAPATGATQTGTRSGKTIAEVKLKPGEVLVRMYDVGFGDCFLVAYDGPKRRIKILVDCGSIAKRKTATKDVVKRLITDVTPPGGQPGIDVVVATHRHADHVSGFANEVWDNVNVKEIWLPWTEDPDDKSATRIRAAQTSFALAMAGVVGVDATMDLDEAGDPEATDDGEDHGVPSRYLALNALSNDGAMARLHGGFSGSPERRFLPKNAAIGERIVTAALPELVTHVLGPSRAQEDVQDMDPPSDQSYLAMKGLSGAPPQKARPFSEEWQADVPQALNDDDKKSIREVNDHMLEVLGVALDKAINGTSLMLMFEVFGKHLLFPGDAQWGTWRRALDDENTARLMKKTLFYKVGHHGSHNATPVRFIENVLDAGQKAARRAMISVRPRSNWKQIPRGPLITAMGDRIGKIARSDVVADQQGFERFGDLYVDTIV